MTRIGKVLGIVGGLGAGWVFALSTPLSLDFVGLGLFPRGSTAPFRTFDLIAVLLIAAVVSTAMFAGRFGWVVTGAGAVLTYVLGEIDWTISTEGSMTAVYGTDSVAQGIVLGGALAALAAADRSGRRAIVPGLAAGSMAGSYLLFTVVFARLDPELARNLNLAPLALCVLAGIGSLILLVRHRDGGAATTGRDWALPATSVVAAGAAIAGVGLAVTDPSRGLYVAAAAVIVIAAVAAWRAGPAAAAWVLVGFVGGAATAIDELVRRRQEVEVWHFAAAAVGGVALGVLLTLLVSSVPWEAIALVGAAAALLASRPPSPLDLLELPRTHYPTGPVIAVALVGLAVAAMLLRLGDGVPELRTAAPAGFASFVVAGVLAAPMSGFVLFENPVWDRRAIAIGVAGLAVLALHLVGVRRHGEPRGLIPVKDSGTIMGKWPRPLAHDHGATN